MTVHITAPTDPELAAEYRAKGLWGAAPLRAGIERIAEVDGGRVAIIDNDGTWTYGELREHIERSIGTLLDAGLRAGEAVVIVAPNSRAAVAAILATIRADGIAVVVDRRCGALDLANAIATSEARVIVVPDELRSKLGVEEHPVQVISIADMAMGLRVTDWAEPDASLPRLVMFTSGTTKRAKGVIHTLETMGAGTRNLAQSLAFTEGDRPFTSSPIATITGLSQVMMALNGASLLLEDRFQTERSLAAIEEHRATVIGGAPIILEMLFAEYDRQGLPTSCLQRIALGGTSIPRPVLEIAINRFGIQPTRVYGSSEVPIHTRSAESDTLEQRLSDDGAPSEGSECRLGDEVVGGNELLVRGPNLFQGYLYEEDNDGAFSGGWFRTGDIVELREGRVRVLGRLKEVAARKGLKISLAEIDDAAKAIGGLQEAAAYSVPDEETGERVALAVRAVDRRPSYDDVVAALLTHGLARGKLPEEIVYWEEPLPRNASGKVVRAQLRDQAPAKARTFAPRLTVAVPDN